MATARAWVGADTGGTFTDLVTADGRVVKVPSTPADPGLALREGIAALGGSAGPGPVGDWPVGEEPVGEEPVGDGPALRPEHLAHGTTVATNALLERRGAEVALVVNRGFADLVEIGRQDRPSLYDVFADRPEPLVPRSRRLEVGGRLDARGAELEGLDGSAVPDVAPGVASVAVCLLHADLDDRHERAVADVLRRRGLDVSCSSEVSPEFREFERAVTTVLNAYLRPVCRRYVAGLVDLADDVAVMTSAGGLVPVTWAAERPVALLLSGPAGGVLAAAAVAVAAGFPDAVTLDMGGTSTDVCLVRGGLPEAAAGRVVGGFPVRLPALDIHTIGAGGGSIARIDPGGALAVGPRSAGADPGPACYGRGGREPTVTDADLVLGRFAPEVALPGFGPLDREAARRALDDAGVSAEGVVAVVDAAMERAIRVVTVERGVDPRGLALVAFGGAGPLHACALAESLGMPAVLVPPRAGALSAVGLLCAPRARELVRSWPTPDDHRGVAEALRALAGEARRAVEEGASRDGTVEVETALDCRYRGQSHEITVCDVSAFPEEHRRRNGYARPEAPVEVVALRASARIASPLAADLLPSTRRERLEGPCVLGEADSTTWVAPGWVGEVVAGGALLLTRRATR